LQIPKIEAINYSINTLGNILCKHDSVPLEANRRFGKMEIGIIGYGVVGKAVAHTISKKYKIVKFDTNANYDKFEDLKHSAFVFVTVPTPFVCDKNEVDESAIIESLNKLEKIGYENVVIIKSTVPPGACMRYSEKYNLNIAFNPEFLRESTTPNEDFENQDTIVIGTDNSETFESIKQMYQAVSVSHARYYHTTSTEAEMIKCAQNTMLASRVALANMIYDACKKHDIDYDKVREIAFDNFEILGPHMVQVPGPDGERGFGGKCLPKDIRAFSTVYTSELLNEIIKYNDSLRSDLDKSLMNYKK
jgi:UDPglucose 6-dehydrogenase